MLFNSLTFAFFLPIVFLLYWFVFQRNLKVQNIFIIVTSYVFYGWWDPRFLFLIIFTSFCSWRFGYKLNIVLNLGILGVFKYYNFFIESFISAFASIGIHLQPSTLKIILPVGISFYTFQALSYSIDVHKKRIEPTKDVIAFFAFISFFPLLVAGPIERAKNLLPQFCQKRIFDYDKAADGMRQILWGLFKKIVIADNCAIYVNKVFENSQNQTSSTLLFGAIFFAFQIYCDFSGYSDIAIGTGRLFGISAMRNFNFPYFARDIAEFWRRWHISLTTWFRDYVYIPLGGSRVSKLKIVRNTLVIFLLSGLWHGANSTFLAWGLFHAVLFLPFILLKKNRKYTDTVAEGKLLPSIREVFQMAYTFLLVVVGWVFFRAESIGQAVQYLQGMFNMSIFSEPKFEYFGSKFEAIMLCSVIMFAVEWLQRSKQHGLDIAMINPLLRRIIYILIIFSIIFYMGKNEQFIYFQF